MANIFYTVASLATAFTQSLNQLINGFNGSSDIGDIIAYPQITTLPGALTAATGATGSLTGAYSYQVTYVTGLVDGERVLHVHGETTVGTASATVSPSAQNVALSGIPIGPTGIIARNVYRTKSGGSIYYFDFQIPDNTTTSWTDTTADTSLVTLVPATNTTGSRFVGNGSGLNPATTAIPGIVKGSTSVPVAVDGTLIVTPASIASSTYAADTGIANAYVVTLSPAPTAYAVGMKISFKALNANTGASTVNVNSLGIKTMTKNVSSALVAGDILVGQIVDLEFDGAQFQFVPVNIPIATTAIPGIAKGSTSVPVAADGTLSATPASIGAATSAQGAEADSTATTLSAHLADVVKHITGTERTTWNAKSDLTYVNSTLLNINRVLSMGGIT